MQQREHEGITGQQLDLSASLSDTKRGSPLKRFDQKITCDIKMLKSRLSQIVKPKTMIFLSSENREGGHMMSIYQDSKSKIYFFDSNAKTGAIPIEDSDHLTRAVWESTDPDKFSMMGVDPLDASLRKNIGLVSYQFRDDPECSYPSEKAFKITTQEFLDILKDNAVLIHMAHRPQMKALIQSLDDMQILEILRENRVSPELKTMLAKHVVLNLEDRSSMLARFLLQYHPNILADLEKERGDRKGDNEDLNIAKEQLLALSKKPIAKESINTINDLLNITDLLTLKEVFNILSLDGNIGNQYLANQLLSSCHKEDKDSLIGLYVVVSKNIQQGHMELAKAIIRITINRFNQALSLEAIEQLGNETFAQFLHQEFGDKYKDDFGTSQLEFMPTKISTNKILNRKKEIMQNLVKSFIQPEKERNEQFIANRTKQAVEIKEFLSLNEVLILLALNPNNLSLAKLFLNSCSQSTSDPGLIYFCVLKENIQNNAFPVAIAIVDIMFEKFKILPSPKSIIELGNKEFSDYIFKTYAKNHENHFRNETDLQATTLLKSDSKSDDNHQKIQVEKIHEAKVNADAQNIRTLQLTEVVNGRLTRTFDSASLEMENQLDISKIILDTTMKRISYYQDNFRENLTEDPETIISNITEQYAVADQKFKRAREIVEKQLTHIQKEASRVLSAIEELNVQPFMSKKIEPNQPVSSIQERLSQLETLARASLSKLESRIEQITNCRDIAINSIKHDINTLEKNKIESIRITDSFCDMFKTIGFSAEQQANIAKNALEVLRIDMESNIENDLRTSLSYAVNIRDISDEFYKTYMASYQKITILEETSIKEIKAMYECKQIDIESRDQFLEILRANRDQALHVINNTNQDVDCLLKVVTDEFQKASAKSAHEKLKILERDILATNSKIREEAMRNQALIFSQMSTESNKFNNTLPTPHPKPKK